MLTSAPTKYGTGITLFGDFLDLDTVHKTIYKIANDGCAEEHVGDFILALAYDVRKAKDDMREKRRLQISPSDKANYKAVSILWPHFLIQVALLRHYAGYRNTDHRDQAVLYLLEDCAVTSLLAYDANVGKECVALFLTVPTLPNDYLFQFFNDRALEFISIPGKERFKELPRLLRSLFWGSPEYRAFQEQAKEQADKHKCSPHDLQDRRDWPKFQW
jgi:hypothetical protein